MEVAEFTFKGSFVDLSDADIANAIAMITVSWSGTNTLWNAAAPQERETKRKLIKNFLVAWYLADMYPLKYKDGQSMGGVPLSSKSIGDTTLFYKNLKLQPQLERLTTNIFGLQALTMLQSCPEFFGLYS